MTSAARSVEALVGAHYDSLYRYAYRLSGSAADAEDLTQDTFGTALLRYGQLRDPSLAKAWLFQILRNKYLLRLRGEKRAKTVPLDSVDDPACRAGADPGAGGGEGGEFPVGPGELQAVLSELDEAFRTPLILYYFEDFSYREIAEQMGLPIGTVMSRLARAKVHLRNRLAPAHDGGGSGDGGGAGRTRDHSEAKGGRP